MKDSSKLSGVKPHHLISPLTVVIDGLEDDSPLRGTDSGSRDGKAVRRRGKSKRKKELEIQAAEEKLLNPGVPENEDDFEKLLRGSPNSSFVWIKYAEFTLSSAGGPIRARSILERALTTIDPQEESERQNIWVTYLNLEGRFGRPKEEAVARVFQRACEQCEAENLHIAMIDVYESTGQGRLLEEHVTMLEKKKKLRKSSRLWLVRLRWYFKNRPKDGKEMLSRALRGIPRHELVTFRSRLAVDRFRCGDIDMGRTIFEGLMREYPKRADLWSVYIDQEVRLGDTPVIRALFERATSLSLPPKKMRFIFKKNLEYEKSVGADGGVELVKKKAAEYVERYC